MTQKIQYKEESIKKLRSHLEYLTNELNKTTEYIQILELQEDINANEIQIEPEREIGLLLQKQNALSHEIILVKKRIQKLSARTILKIELVILPIVVILLCFMTANYLIQPADVNFNMKTRYAVENLKDSTHGDLNYWDIPSQAPLIVSINNKAQVGDRTVQAAENAILSTEKVSNSNTSDDKKSSSEEFFKGWQGALQTMSDTKYKIPEKFSIIQSQNGEGQIVLTFSTIHSDRGFFGSTQTIADGNQILKVFITIYDSGKLTDNQVESLVRHEFGHALGLPYSSNSNDVMFDTLTTGNSYITSCDINALEKLYNGMSPEDGFCK